MHSITKLVFTRFQNKSQIKALLSEEYKIKRRKKNKVSIQMTVMSWSLEFLTGYLGMSAVYLARNNGKSAEAILAIVYVDIFLNFIVIPSTYVFNNDVNKTVIITEGWRMLIKTCFRSNRVQPTADDNDGQI